MVFDIPFRVLASRPIVEACQILQKFVTHVNHCLTAKHVYTKKWDLNFQLDGSV